MKSMHRILAFALVLVMIFADGGIAALAQGVLAMPASLKIIDEEAFYGSTSIDKVTLPNGVTEIRSKAFANSTISEIYLPDSLTYIADDAFENCNKVTARVVPDTFAEQYALSHENIDIIAELSPEESENINQYSFSTNDKGEVVLAAYHGTDDSLYLPRYSSDGKLVTRTADKLFSGNTNIKGVIIPGTYKELGQRTFENCSSLQEVYIIDGTKVLGWNLFSGCTSLRKVVLPDSIDYMFERLFENCSSLHEITYPLGMVIPPADRNWTQGWAYKHASAFNNSSVTTIYIPYGATTIMKDAFWDASSVKDIYIPETVVSINPDSGSNGATKEPFMNIKSSVTIHGVTGSTAETYAIANGIKFVDDYTVMPTSISLSSVKLYMIEGETAHIEATVYPENATNKELTWASSNENVITVEDGVVTAVSEGKAYVRITTCNGLEYLCTVTVTKSNAPTDIPANTIHILSDTNSSMLSIGSTIVLSAVITPENATDKTVIWSSSDETIATVSKDGIVTAINSGICTVSAITSNGLRAYIEINVSTSVNTPSAPENVHAHIDRSGNIKVSWNKTNDAEGYYVYFISEDGNEDYVAAYSKNKEAITIEHEYLEPNTKYTIYVCAFNEKGVSEHSVSVEIKTLALPDTPVITAVIHSITEIGIDWNSVENADGYKVYYNDEFEKPEIPYGVYDLSTNQVVIKDVEPNTEYYIWLSAYNLIGEVFNDVICTVKTAPYTFVTVDVPDSKGLGGRSSAIRMPFAGGIKEIIVNSNEKWTGSTNGDWLHISRTEGQGYDIITVTADAVPETISSYGRVAAASFICGLSFKQIWFEQNAAPYIHAELIDNDEFEASSTTKTINVESEGAWSAEVFDDWVHIIPANGVGNAVVTLYVDENRNKEPRETYLNFTCDGFGVTNLSQIHFSQVGKDIRLSTPVITSYDADGSHIGVSWNRVEGATGYIVYVDNDNSYFSAMPIPLDGGDTTYFIYEASERCMHHIYVTAILQEMINGETVEYESYNSSSIDVDVSASDAPFLQSISTEGFAITVSWNKAENITGYRLYDRLASDETNSSYYEIDKDATSFTYTSDPGLHYVTLTTCTDVTNESGYYHILESRHSNELTVSIQKPSKEVGTPHITGISATSQTITVEWDTPANAGLYNVYYSHKNNIKSAISKDQCIVSIIDANSITIRNLRPEYLYYVWVEAESWDDTCQPALSEPVAITTQEYLFEIDIDDSRISRSWNEENVEELVLPENSPVGYSYEMSISAEESWTAKIYDESKAGWITLSSMKGKAGTKVITVTVNEVPAPMHAFYSKLMIETDTARYIGSFILRNTKESIGEVKVSNISINGGDRSIEVNTIVQMNATVLPSNANNTAVTWSIENGTGTATINSSGKVCATSAGTVFVTATANDGTGKNDTITLTIYDDKTTNDLDDFYFSTNKSTAIVGEEVLFSIVADNTKLIRLIVDDKPYNEYAITSREKTISRSFSASGTRKVKFQRYINGQWEDSQEEKAITITSYDTLGKPSLTLPDTIYQGENLIVEWPAVPNATEYVVYVSFNGESWYNETIKNNIGINSITISKDVLNYKGNYSIEVIATGYGYGQAGSTSDVEVVVKEYDINIIGPSAKGSYIVGDRGIEVSNPDGGQVIILVKTPEGITHRFPSERGYTSKEIYIDYEYEDAGEYTIAAYVYDPNININIGASESSNDSVTVNIGGVKINSVISNHSYVLSGNDITFTIKTNKLGSSLRVYDNNVTTTMSPSSTAESWQNTFTYKVPSNEPGIHNIKFVAIDENEKTSKPVNRIIYVIENESPHIMYPKKDSTRIFTLPSSSSTYSLVCKDVEISVVGNLNGYKYAIFDDGNEGFFIEEDLQSTKVIDVTTYLSTGVYGPVYIKKEKFDQSLFLSDLLNDWNSKNDGQYGWEYWYRYWEEGGNGMLKPLRYTLSNVVNVNILQVFADIVNLLWDVYKEEIKAELVKLGITSYSNADEAVTALRNYVFDVCPEMAGLTSDDMSFILDLLNDSYSSAYQQWDKALNTSKRQTGWVKSIYNLANENTRLPDDVNFYTLYSFAVKQIESSDGVEMIGKGGGKIPDLQTTILLQFAKNETQAELPWLKDAAFEDAMVRLSKEAKDNKASSEAVLTALGAICETMDTIAYLDAINSVNEEVYRRIEIIKENTNNWKLKTALTAIQRQVNDACYNFGTTVMNHATEFVVSQLIDDSLKTIPGYAICAFTGKVVNFILKNKLNIINSYVKYYELTRTAAYAYQERIKGLSSYPSDSQCQDLLDYAKNYTHFMTVMVEKYNDMMSMNGGGYSLQSYNSESFINHFLDRIQLVMGHDF